MSTTRPLAVITGGTRGIGLGIARALAEAGFAIGVTGRRGRADITETLNELAAISGEDVFYFSGDLGDSAERQRLLDELRTRYETIACWVNNAGMGPPKRVDILEVDEADFDLVLSVNMKAAHFLTQSVARWMTETECDHFRSIVNITSVSAEMVSLNRAEYCIAKAGLRMSTKLFAARLAPEKIGVYEVAPGIIKTDMTAGVKEKYDALIADGLIPEMRWGQPSDIGSAVAAIATGQLSYATGTCLRLDGGMTIPRL